VIVGLGVGSGVATCLGTLGSGWSVLVGAGATVGICVAGGGSGKSFGRAVMKAEASSNALMSANMPPFMRMNRETDCS
jgi:hypothetical protein